MMHSGWHGGTYMWLIIIVIAVAVIYYLFKRNRNGGRMMVPPDESPLDILKKRYAKGEITEEEYHRMKNEIKE